MNPSPSLNQKDTIYLDIDEEITSIISKVQNSPKNIVALVLPKRASVLQSTVNMKLLKRSTSQANKKIVLITSEAGLLPLAGAAGIYVANNLNAKPYLPPSPNFAPGIASEQAVSLDDAPIDPNTPIGELMDDNKDSGDPIEIDNTVPEAAAGVAVAAKSVKKKSGNKLSVPNFDRFRKKFFIAGAILLLLLIGGYWAFFLAPKATITLKTESKEVTAPISFTADTALSEPKYEDQKLPADKNEISKTDTEKVPATGQKDKGTKASGTVTMSAGACGPTVPSSVPAGSGISSNNLTFITQSTAQFVPVVSGGQCTFQSSSAINVVAQQNGDKYNLAPSSYAVAERSGVIAQGSAMAGGTSSIVKVINQIDIDAAKQKISDKQKGVKDELKQQFSKDDLVPIVETFTSSTPVINATPAVDTEASEVTVTSVATYTMLGVKKDELKKLISLELKKQPETEKQNVLNDGIDTAAFATGKKPSSTSIVISMQTTVILGPDLNQDQLKKEIAGQKSGEAESMLGKIPGVTEARVELKPFWVTKVSSKSQRVNIIIQQANGQTIKP